MSSIGETMVTMVCSNPIWTDTKNTRGFETVVSKPRFLFVLTRVSAL